MNRSDIIKKMAIKSGIGQEKCDNILEAFIESITESLLDGNEISIRGFGRFGTRNRQARICRDPRTGQTIEAPERTIPTFKFSSKMRNTISGNNC